MDLQNSRVPNPPPSQSAELSTPTSDASYSMLQNAQHVPSSNSFDFYGVQANNSMTSVAPVITHPSQAISAGLLTQPGEYSQSLQTAGQFGGTQFHSQQMPLSNASMWNTASLFLNNFGSASNPMTALRNGVIGYPDLAPAPTSAPPKPAPIAKTLTEASTPSVVQVAPGTATSALSDLTYNKPNGSQTLAIQAQPVLPAPNLSINPTITQKQSTPLKSSPGKTSVKSRKRRIKRKRAHDSEDEIKAHDSSSDDESEDMLPSARQTKSGRQVNRPTFFAPSPEPVSVSRQKSSPSGTATATPAKRRRKVYRKNGKEINVTCRHCQRGHSPVTNMIVFCDECNDAYHQYCHDPPIKQELIDDKDAEWFCSECRPETRHRVLLKLKLPPQQENTPSITSPISSVPLVCGEQFTAEEQRGYLSSLSHAALVDMLVTLSKANPTLPVFPENLKDLQRSKFAVTTATTIHAASELTEEVTMETKDAASPSVDEEDSDADSDSGSEYEVEEHRLYPRSGNGFHLPPEEDDFDILLDDPACPTFSYTLHSYSQANSLADKIPIVQVGG
ncbi:hypothetical protein TMatcc_004631 [Talaromyces marneffei ATCC 18224]|uniref:PHD finger domain protein, putative n=1 Tax=Talaromyces marneffei (strain ATCC 18224 / CBS 334.59 / QM 7333) TaxID=441960 RepID=B6Q3I9_TALMQ|nr:uncharacterized protein EYB26_000440 [Talaromyces marneffei]EEA27095.1 PHD finger domain protein, putative [Talaromyces marneffei ATCC 18224]QGA12795.1 hypothetical protein EYB26_000440 [Talaromyces marneffei]